MSGSGKVVNDPRFAKLGRDPRFQKPRQNVQKTKIDQRFNKVFDAKFRDSVSVDKYGRGKTKHEQRDIERLYQLEDQEEHEEESEEESEEEEDLFTSRGEALLARARGQVEVSSSDEEESESEEEEEEKEEEIPTGEATCILGAFNLDWDEIEAEDLLVLLSSFLPAGGVITEVEIRATKEGASAMELEDTKGPQIDEGELSSEDEDDDPFADAQAHKSLDARVAYEEKEEERSRRANEILRRYAKKRMGYYVGLIHCDSPSTAEHLYRQCDGMEFEHSANTMDLRAVQPSFLPKLVKEPRSRTANIRTDYKAPAFATKALEHTKVEIAWEKDDPKRTRLLQQDFSKGDYDDEALKNLMANSSSEGEEDEDNEASASKYQSLLGGGDDEDGDDRTHDVEIKWNVGLEQAGKDALERRKQKQEQQNMSIFEQYEEKRKEKRKARKKGKKATTDEDDQEVEPTPKAKKDKADPFNDPFFAAEPDASVFDDPFFEQEPDNIPEQAPKAKTKDKTKTKKGKLSAEAKAAQIREKAEMELLMLDEDEDQHEATRGFDMNAVGEQEGKKKKKKKSRHRKKGAEDGEDEGRDSGFTMDTADPRFMNRLVTDDQFHIDQTSGKLKQTTGMKALQQEVSKKRGKRKDRAGGQERALSKSQQQPKQDSLQRLVSSVKAKNEQIHARKKSKKQWD